MDLKEIQSLIRFVAKSGATEVELETDGVKISIKTKGEGEIKETTVVQHVPVAAAPQVQAAPPAPAPAAPAAAPQATESTGTGSEEDNSKYIEIKSPMIGTFYRRPAPDKDPFISVGDEVRDGSVVCVIEAMKLFNEIESEVSGKIVKVLVEDQSPVEYDQPLFLVDPS